MYKIDTISTEIREFKITLPTVKECDEWLKEARRISYEFGEVYSVWKGLQVQYAEQEWDDSKSLFIVCTKTALNLLVDAMA